MGNVFLTPKQVRNYKVRVQQEDLYDWTGIEKMQVSS